MPPPRPMLACSVSNAPPGGKLSTSHGWSCILGGLALLLLMFRVPLVVERSDLFVKELLFPQTTLTDDAFFNRTGLELVGVAGSELELSLGRSARSGCWIPLLKQETKRTGGGFARCRSDA